jgi:hypothetical protein
MKECLPFHGKLQHKKKNMRLILKCGTVYSILISPYNKIANLPRDIMETQCDERVLHL